MSETTPEFLNVHARQKRANARAVAAVSLRYRDEESITLLSLMASGGVLTYQGVLAEARRLIGGAQNRSVSSLTDLHALAALGRAIAGRPGPGPDFSEAADLHQALRLLGHTPHRRDDTHRLEAQTNLAVGRLGYVAGVLKQIELDDDSRWMLETDLVNPVVGRPGTGEQKWLRSFNRLFTSKGLIPVSLSDEQGTLFDRLMPAQTPVRSQASGPLVTIVMSVFKPDQSLFTALRSLVDQTWPHLEILVVDDCSGPEFEPLLAEAAALDERIELIVMPENGGTYKIRNFAIERAQGEIIGFQDSDDWSHPERIERQLQLLLTDPNLVASLSRAVRVTSDVVTSKVGYPTVRPNASSIMFRRETVMAALGGFDEVRKSADAEFAQRMQTVFGRERILETKLPLALVQLSQDSLSLEDFRFGWQDANRVSYRDTSNYWHTLIAAGSEPSQLTPAEPRRFPAPRRFLGADAPIEDTADVLIVSDWRPGHKRYAGGVQEATALSDSGIVTAVAHAETMRYANPRRQPPYPSLLALQAEGRVLAPQWRDTFHSRLVLVRDPELLSYSRPPADVGLRSDRVIIRAAFGPRAPEGDLLVYEPAYVQQRAQELFGVEAEWLPAHDGIAQALELEGAHGVLPSTRLGVLALPAPRRSGLRGGPRPVIGTTDIEALSQDRPTWKALLECFPDDDRLDVRIRDSRGALAKIKESAQTPPNWLVSDADPLGSFLRQLDFFIGLPMRTWGPEPMNAAMVAMSQGCVVLLDHSYEPHFGDAATYWGDGSPGKIVAELVKDHARFAAQQQRGYDFIATEMSPQTFATRIAGLAGTSINEKRSS